MGTFFDRFKKNQTPVADNRPPAQPAIVIQASDALPPNMEGQIQPKAETEKELEYDTYDDNDETAEGEISEPIQKDSIPNSEEDSDDDEEDEEAKLERELVRVKEKIEQAKLDKIENNRRKAEEEARRRSGQTMEEESTPEYIQVPVYLTGGEFLREIMKRVQGLEVWAQQLTNYIKSKESK